MLKDVPSTYVALSVQHDNKLHTKPKTAPELVQFAAHVSVSYRAAPCHGILYCTTELTLLIRYGDVHTYSSI